MNRQEYMSKLKATLTGFNQNIATEIITDYEEHFDIGAAEGRTEEQICEELGSIQDLINEISQMENRSTTYINNTEEGKTFTVTHITNAEGEKTYTVTDTTNTDKTETDTKTDTDTEIDTKTDTDTEIDTERTDTDKTDAENGRQNKNICRRVVVNAANADVNIRPSRNNSSNFDYENHGSANQMLAYKFEYHQEGDTLYASVVRRSNGTNWFFSRIKEPHMVLNIKLEKGLERVNIRTDTGDISVDDISVGEFDINTLSGDAEFHNVNIQHLRHKSLNGDIELERISGESINIKSTSGDAKMFGLNSKRVVAETLSGDISMNNCYIENSNIRTASGDMELERCTLDYCDLKTASGSSKLKGIESRTLHVEAKSGDVTVNARAKDVTIKSMSGDVRAYIDGDAKLSLYSTSGDINATLMNIDGYNANVSTVSGGVGLYFRNETKTLRSGSVSFGNGASEVNATTVSGSIRING